MTNRLLHSFRTVTMLSGIILYLCQPTRLVAQAGFFNFTPPANTTIPAGSTCSAALSGNIANPTVTSTIGATITMSMFDPAASGYQFTDQFPAPYTLVVSWFVKDNMGHSHNFEFTVNIVDVTPPQFDLTGIPANLSFNSIVAVPDPPVIPVNENCQPGMMTQSFIETQPPAICEAGVFTRTWTATDVSGNSSVFTQTITIFKDSLPPTISVFPQNGAASCKQLATAYPNWLATQMANFAASDPSGIKSLINNGPASFPPGCKVPLTVTFRAIDNCDLIMPVTAVFSTADNEPPIILSYPKDTVAYCTPAGSPLAALGNWIHHHGYLSAIDSCTEPNLMQYEMRVGNIVRDSAQVVAALLASYSAGCDSQMIGNISYGKVRGKVQVEFYVKDGCGQTVYAGPATFGVIDTIPPVITGNSITEACGGASDAAALAAWINAKGNCTLSDECSSAVWSNFTWTTSTNVYGSGLFGPGPFPQIIAHNCSWWVDVNFYATDDCGNVGVKKLRFQITDMETPVIAGFPPTVTLPCTNPNPTLSPVYVTDNCDTSMQITYTAVNSDSLCDGSYKRTVTWAATDDCGNTGYAVQIVLVRDTIGPLFTLLPPPQTFYCDTFVLPSNPVMGVNINAADACSPVVSITTQINSLQNPNPAVCGHYNYNIIRIFTASDECGNTRTATQVLTVFDSVGPVFSGYLDTTAVCEVTPIMPPPTANDACSGPTAAPVLQNQVVTAGSCADSYTLTLNWIARDVCNNPSYFSQDILIIDTVPPTVAGIPGNIFVECDAVPAPPPVSSFTATDNCDESVTIVLNETEIRDPNPANCAHWTNYVIKREWTATDNCGNSRTYTQFINVQDNTGPVLTPPAAVTLPADLGFCGANTLIPAPISIYDQCTSLRTNVVLRDTVPFTVANNDLTNTPVDTIRFQWAAPNLPPANPVVGVATLSVFLENADAEDTIEYFRVYGEGGQYIGKTTNSAIPCGFSTSIFSVSAANLNQWLSDGQLTLTLVPNGLADNAINAYCTNDRARATLSYQIATQQIPLTVTYSLDGQASQPYPPSDNTFLDVGQHTVVYTATDCTGNASTASTTITIQDLQPPVVLPPVPITAYVGANCTATVALPFPVISENCDVSGLINQASANVPVQFMTDPNAGVTPKDITLTLSGLIPNAITSGKLKIRHKGDNAQALAGEFFRVFDDNNQFVGATNSIMPASLECQQYNESVITVPANKINSWATSGSTFFTLKANKDVVNNTDFINPCGPLAPDGTDNISRVQIELDYTYALVSYEIRKNGNLVQSGALSGSQTSVTLGAGVYQVKYIVQDIHGLEGTATYTLTVQDTIRPTAKCLSKIIQTNVSGLVNYTLTVPEVNNNSTDNCPGPLTYQLSQTVFNCNMATPPNNIYSVIMTVTDASGNTSTCTSIIQVQTAPLTPTYDPVCVGGTLNLHANPPAAPGGNGVYSYMWVRPSGQNLPGGENPSIANVALSDEGTYTVTVTGVTGCMAVGYVNVDLASLPDAPTLNYNGPPMCAGNNIVLSTFTYSGQNVWYHWYQLFPSGNSVEIDSTQASQYTINQPAVGVYQYFVKVTASGCSSNNSQPVTITVQPKPVATVAQAFITVCKGQPVILNSTNSGNYTYQWTGPNMYSGNTAQPPVIAPSDTIHSGDYSLVVTQNGCVSDPAIVKVTVKPAPPKPLISGDLTLCAGTTAVLVCDQTNAGLYIWEKVPNLQTIINNAGNNSLNLPNIAITDAGNWRVRTVLDDCLSEWSDPVLLQVKNYPDVAATNNIIMCQGDTLKLAASSNDPQVSWCWTGPGAYIAYTNPATRFPGVSGTYKVVGKIEAGFGCADSAFVDVQVATPPVVGAVTNNAPPCPNGTTSATLQAVVTSSNYPLMYFWYHPVLSPGSLFSTDSMPVIPNVTASNNGDYLLVVKDKFGCVSNTGSTNINIGAALQPPDLIVTSDTVCAGTPVTFTVSNNGQYPTPVKYLWTIPGSATPIETTQPNYVITSPQANQSGLYKVQVMSGICASPISIAIWLQVYPIPATPVPMSNSPVCDGEKLNLFVSNLSTNPNAQYTWFGPNGTVLTGANPMIMPVSETNQGNYTVKVVINGCTSFSQEPIVVTVNPKPQKPFILPPNPLRICRNQPGATLHLQLNTSFITPGSSFTWIYLNTNDTIFGPAQSSSFSTTNLTPFVTGANRFRVVATLNGCSSEFSDSVTVYIDEIPGNNAYAGGNLVHCTSQQLNLQGVQPVIGNGLWTQTGGPPVTIVDPDNPLTPIDTSTVDPGQTYQFTWTLSNGGCVNYDSDVSTVTTVAPEQARVPNNMVIVCSDTMAVIHAFQGMQSKGYWTQLDGQGTALGIKILTPDSTTTIVTGLREAVSADYYFYWNLPDIGCGPSQATVIVRHFAKPYAGPDQLCITTQTPCAELMASPLQGFETGQWTSTTPNVQFSAPTSNITTACNLTFGDNLFIWTTNEDTCGTDSHSQLIVNYEFPTAVPDVVALSFGGKLSFNVLSNDILPDQFSLSVTSLPSFGKLDSVGNGIYTYQANGGFSGTDMMVYQICNLLCANNSACSAATVTFTVGQPEICQIPNIITPNHDNINDQFIVPISCALGEGELKVEITIFNEWGDHVYHGIQEGVTPGWDGTYNGEDLPAGTYFYVIRIEGETDPRSGFIILQR